MRCLLVLTATVQPGGMIYTERKDPQIRLKDYILSLKRWCSNQHVREIVFCENSGYDLSKIKQYIDSLKSHHVNLLQFNGNDFPKCYGKGYGEFLILKYVANNFDLTSYDYIIKCTGRLYVLNFSKTLGCLSLNPDIVASMRKSLKYCDSRYFIMKKNEFLNFIEQEPKINDKEGYYMEHFLAQWILKQIINDKYWIPFSQLPLYMGYSGTSGEKLYSYKNLLKYKLKQSLYRISSFITEV